MMMETKNCELRLKGLDIKNRIVEGYFAIFNNVDSQNEMFVKGAFAKTIAENGTKGKNRIKHLYNHFDTVGVLQELYEDDEGVRFVSKIGTHTLGNDVLRMIDEGLITENSVGYQYIPDKIEYLDGVTVLKEVKMWEGSSLDKWGANDRAVILKSLDEVELYVKNLQEKVGLIEKSVSGRTNFSDETYYELIAQVGTIKQMIDALCEMKSLQGTLAQKSQKDDSQNLTIDIDKIIANLKTK